MKNDFDLLASQQLALKLRRHVLRLTNRGGGPHVGSAFSISDIVAVLFGATLRLDPTQPNWPLRDRFFLSKGHAGVCLYAALAERGFMTKSLLDTYYMNGSTLSGHVSHKDVPGVEMSTGSLGMALGVATGSALAAKLDNQDRRTFCLMSDGECDEGSVWEAILFAAHHKLENLVAVVDYNKIQSLASVSETIGLEPFADKLIAANWSVEEVDGHDHAALRSVFEHKATGKPRFIIAHTTKGKGVSFMENKVLWHYRTAQGAEYDAAVAELDALEASIGNGDHA